MEDLSFVAEVQASQELEEKQLYIVRVEGTRAILHVATEVCVLGGRERGRGKEGEGEGERESRIFVSLILSE